MCAELNIRFTFKDAMTVDIYGGGNSASNNFVDYINDVSSGTTILIMTG